MRPRMLVVPALLMALVACSVQFNSGDKDKHVSLGTAAQRDQLLQAARPVLADIDHGRYARLWQRMAPLIRQRSTEPSWADQLSALHSRYGAAERRTIKGFGFSDHVDHAPAGHFGVLAFRTQFRRAPNVGEKLVFMRVHGHWDLVGYFLFTTVISIDPGGHAQGKSTPTAPG